MGLSRKILLGLVLAIAMLVACVQWYFGKAIRASLVENADRFTRNQFEQTLRGVEQVADRINAAANMLYLNEKIARTLNSVGSADAWTRYESIGYIRQEIRSIRNILLPNCSVDIWLLSPGGSVASLSLESMRDVSIERISGSEWYCDALLAHGSRRWLTPSDAYFEGCQPGFLTLVQPVLGEANFSGVRGLLIINLREADSFHPLLRDAAAGTDAHLLIVNEAGQIISASDRADMGRQLAEFQFSERVLKGAQSGRPEPFQVQAGGELVHVNHQPIARTGWLLLRTVPYDSITRGVDEIQARFLWIVSLIGLGILLIAAGFAARMIRPIRQMVAGAQRIAQGDFSQRLEIRRADEIGRLAGAFDQMSDDIQTLLNDLRREAEARGRLNLEVLKGQLDPHFLFNALNSVKCVALVGKNDTIAAMVTDLAYLLETALSKNGEFTTLGEELEFAAHYAALQRIRFSSFEYSQQVAEGIANAVVPRMIVQPLIDNSIRHGFQNRPLDGEIRLEAWREGERLRIHLSDNGVGMAREAIEDAFNMERESRSVGLSNIHQRFRIYYGTAFDLRIQSGERGGVCVGMDIPYREGSGPCG